jgi:uncharacterized alpha-E superfamily protein
VAYRRRHRSDIEIGSALDLVIHDESNPRSLAASLATLREHTANGETSLGDQFAAQAAAAMALPSDEMVPRLRQLVVGAGAAVVGRWFSTPVYPIVMRPTGGGW